mgnify:CR=1 FL=1
MNENKNTENTQDESIEQVVDQQDATEAGHDPKNQETEAVSQNPEADSEEIAGDASDSDQNLSEDDEIEQLKEQLAQQADEAAAMKDAYIRAKAEEDNVRRRAEKEVSNSRKFAVEGFAKELLSVRDSLAIAAALELDADSDAGVKSIKDGVDITLKQLDAALAKYAVVEVAAAVGDVLDPNVHQAMSIVEAQDVESGCIVNVIQAGFTMHERLLRPAMVIVAK